MGYVVSDIGWIIKSCLANIAEAGLSIGLRPPLGKCVTIRGLCRLRYFIIFLAQYSYNV